MISSLLPFILFPSPIARTLCLQLRGQITARGEPTTRRHADTLTGASIVFLFVLLYVPKRMDAEMISGT